MTNRFESPGWQAGLALVVCLFVMSGMVGLYQHYHERIADAFGNPNLVAGSWDPSQPSWWEPQEPLAAPLRVSPLVCMLKVPDSPERVC